MKSFFFSLLVLLSISTLWAQAPQKLSYQAIIRDADGALLANQGIRIEFSILQGSASGPSVYTEVHTPTTNPNGLVTTEVGTGTVVSGDLGSIDWNNGPYYIQSQTDPTGGYNYVIINVNELMSVPYAFFANEADSARIAGYADLAENALTAMTAQTASYADSAGKAWYAHTANNAYTADYTDSSAVAWQAHTAYNAQHADYADSSAVAWYAYTANNAYTTDYADSSAVAWNAHTAYNAQHADYADSSAVAWYAYTANNAYTADYADSSAVAWNAHTAYNAYTADYADSSAVAWNAHTAYNAYTADYADSSAVAWNAHTAYNAQHADYSDSAAVAWNAHTAYNAQHADYADSAAVAWNAHTAYNAQHADYADSAAVAWNAYTAYSAHDADYADSTAVADYAHNVASRKRSIIITPGMVNAAFMVGGATHALGPTHRPCIELPEAGNNVEFLMSIPIPTEYKGSSFGIRMFYSTTDNGDFIVRVSTRGNSVGDDLTLGTGGPNINVPAATPDILSEATGTLTHTIDANTQLLQLQIRRRSATAGDTSTGILRVYGVVLEFDD